MGYIIFSSGEGAIDKWYVQYVSADRPQWFHFWPRPSWTNKFQAIQSMAGKEENLNSLPQLSNFWALTRTTYNQGHCFWEAFTTYATATLRLAFHLCVISIRPSRCASGVGVVSLNLESSCLWTALSWEHLLAKTSLKAFSFCFNYKTEHDLICSSKLLRI